MYVWVVPMEQLYATIWLLNIMKSSDTSGKQQIISFIHSLAHKLDNVRAKGLHTNLLLALKITEDCRFCFVGVMKGSSEMLAIQLPALRNAQAKGVSLDNSIAESVVTYAHQDAKLRGFGTAAKVLHPQKTQYR